MKHQQRSIGRGSHFTTNGTDQNPIRSGRHQTHGNDDSGSIECDGHAYDTAYGWRQRGYQLLSGGDGENRIYLTRPDLDGYVILHRSDHVHPMDVSASELIDEGFEICETKPAPRARTKNDVKALSNVAAI
jgi:hypothetical protein